ncbi:hypothetical protein PCANC_24007 [Puccinia coronata f. sp. avenae]|uniref:Polynucleotide kinase 3'-phosphatase n=1 Tax=Puccinia coronata f. sp. avenae TaxID=200324 RepID=A0A2N5TX73_9BASI|nr:hypothetical protein PCANC_24007 [Puccinia coronata f. sp. avenae]
MSGRAASQATAMLQRLKSRDNGHVDSRTGPVCSNCLRANSLPQKSTSGTMFRIPLYAAPHLSNDLVRGIRVLPRPDPPLKVMALGRSWTYLRLSPASIRILPVAVRVCRVSAMEGNAEQGGAPLASHKRSRSNTSAEDTAPASKKTAPIFENVKAGLKLTWLEPIAGSCLHGVCGDPSPSSKIAAFDIDGTLIKVKSGKKFPANADDWKLWANNIPKKLQGAHADGYAIVLLSNQNFKAPKYRKDFESKLIQLARTLSVPLRVFAARETDKFRKPLTGMWDEFLANWNGGIQPNLSDSFFVGDAAGRPATTSSPKDWNDTDRKLALNIGVSFFTPEEWFSGEPTRTDFVLSGFDPLKYDHDHPAWHPSTTPVALAPVLPSDAVPKHSPCELVLFVGPPSVGKTTFFEKHFMPRGYRHVNQDTLKQFGKCMKAVHEAIHSSRSCVVDNTNPGKATRLSYIQAAQRLGCGIRCVFFSAPVELAQHNNVYRAAVQASRALLPSLAFVSYSKNFEEPSVEEGFTEIKKVRFVFDGSPQERASWQKYLL